MRSFYIEEFFNNHQKKKMCAQKAKHIAETARKLFKRKLIRQNGH